MKVSKQNNRNVPRVLAHEKLSNGNSSSVEAVGSAPGALDSQGGLFETLFSAPGKVVEAADNISALSGLFEQLKQAIRYGPDSGSTFSEDVISRLEDVLALVVGLASSTSPSNMMSIIMLYGRTIYARPFCLSLRRLIHHCLQSDVEHLHEQSGVEVRSLMDSFSHNPLRRGFAAIASVLLVAGLLPEHSQSKTAFHLYDLFGVRVSQQTCGATTLMELILDVAKFTLDHVLPALKSNDLSLLWTDLELNTVDDDYNRIVGARDLLETGNISMLPKMAHVETDQDYLNLLLDVRDRLIDIRARTKSPPVVSSINAKLLVLSKIESSLYMAWKKDPIRVKPFAICISGGSGVNKTTVYEITNRAICSINGFKCDHTTNITLNGDDKYQSEMHPRVQSVLFDDAMNTNLDKMEGIPTTKWLQFINNAHCNALNAQADKKGVMAINCKLVFVTTNRPDLGAYVFSVEPASILRRFELHVSVKIKPECVDPATGMAYASMLNQSLPDCWEFEVFQARIVRMGPDKRDKVDMHCILRTDSIAEYLDLVKSMSKAHFALQNRMVRRAGERQNEPWCPEHHFPADACPHCLKHAKLDCGHSLDSRLDCGKCAQCELSQWVQTNPDDVYTWDRFVANNTAQEYTAAVESLEAIDNQSGPDDDEWEDLVSEPWWVSPVIDFRQHTHRVSRLLADKRSTIIDTLLGVAALGVAYSFFRISSAYAKLFTANCVPQDSLPVKLEPVYGVQRVEKPVMWRRADYLPNHRPEAARTSTTEQLAGMVTRNLAFVRYWSQSVPTVIKVCNALPARGNVWILPSHIFDLSDKLELEFHVPQARSEDRVFKSILTKDGVAFVADADLIVAVIQSSGSMPNFVKYMASSSARIKSAPYLTCIYNNRGETDVFSARSSGVHTVKLNTREYTGLTYDLVDRVTKFGLCGMIVVEDAKTPLILGLHTAGRENTSFGVSSQLFSDRINDAIAKLCAPGLFEQSSGPLSESKYGIGIRYDLPPPSKSPVRFLPADLMRNYELLGSTGNGCATFRTSMRISPYSVDVEHVLDLPRVHCPPNTKQQWTSPQRVLEKITRTKPPLDPVILRKVQEDLISSSSACFQAEGKFAPLDYTTVINGVDGIRGLDRMDCTTSAGFPLNRPKGDLMVEVESDDKRAVVREFDVAKADVIAECERIKDIIRSGERPSFLFQSVMKDEGVSLKKFKEKKNRVFQCCEVAAVALFRQYFLMLLRVEQKYGFRLESGVGINAASPEFGTLYQFLADFSTEKCFAGDYAGFDTSMPLEITAITYEYYLHFARLAGYSEDDLCIMRGLCCEAMYPLVEFFGAWVYLPGLTPSGIPLTVHKNNNDNRCLMRYTYYLLNGLDAPPFTQEVRLGCYGDDNVVAVRDGSKITFDHVSVSRAMSTFGVEYTAADKSSTFPPYVPIMSLEFLKRSFRNDPDLGIVGVLDEKSISKSLHLYRKNNKCLLTLPQLLAQSFESAAREWFLYGRDVYERRVRELNEVAQKEVDGVQVSRYLNFHTFDELKERYYTFNLWN